MDFDKDTIVAQTAQFVQATVAKKCMSEFLIFKFAPFLFTSVR